MCLTAFMIGGNSENQKNGYRLVLAFNRDEYYARPAKPAAFWPDNNHVIGGMDMTPGREGGTWLALNSKTGRLALVVNIRRPDSIADPPGSAVKGRGYLVSDFVTGNQGCKEYLQDVAKEGDLYNGFNLVTADFSKQNQVEMYHYCNKSDQDPQNLEPGVHAMSNSHFDTPWNKATHAKNGLAEIIANAADRETLIESILQLMKNDVPLNQDKPLDELTTTPDELFEALPDLLCVKMPDYGTRSHAVIIVDAQGEVTYTECYLLEPIDAKNRKWKTQTVTFNLDNQGNEKAKTKSSL